MIKTDQKKKKNDIIHNCIDKGDMFHSWIYSYYSVLVVDVLVHLLPVLSNMNAQTRFLEAPRVLRSRSEREGPRESHFEAGTIARWA